MLLSFPKCLLLSTFTFAESALADYESQVKPFFQTHCISCHGPEKSKGKITLHTLDGDLSKGHDLERWELILEMLGSGEMPPEDEPQPDTKQSMAVAKWSLPSRTNSTTARN